MQPISSGLKSTSGTGAVKILAGVPGTLMRGGNFWNPTSSGAGQISFDGGVTYPVDFPAGAWGPVQLPPGFYALDLYIKRVGGTDVAGMELVLFPAEGAV